MLFFRLPLVARRAAWIALLAVFALALAPTVSRLLAAHAGSASAWAEICTPQGTRWIALAADGVSADAAVDPQATPPGSSVDTLHLEHCPLCGLGAHAPVLPTAALTWQAPAAGRALMPPLFSQAPRPLFAWAAAQPRGPPAQA